MPRVSSSRSRQDSTNDKREVVLCAELRLHGEKDMAPAVHSRSVGLELKLMGFEDRIDLAMTSIPLRWFITSVEFNVTASDCIESLDRD